MSRRHVRLSKPLAERFPPSESCTCAICTGYCARPGWWTVAEAGSAIRAGYAGRMMIEIPPDRSFCVLAPAFRGCEGLFAAQEFSQRGCTFFADGLCALHGTGLMPLECRFCHHERAGQGVACHLALEHDWDTPAGQELVALWQRITGFWKKPVNRRMRDAIRGAGG